jgi:Methyltransferase domain
MRLARVRRAKTADDIPGWFPNVDRDLFRTVLAWQVANEAPGDLVELVGESLRPGETFTVCDLFGETPADESNAAENEVSYPFNRQQFERNYLRFHPELPVILQMPTSQILEHVEPGTARFVHVDASHLYDQVVVDVFSARRMLRPAGIVVFDDYRANHTPGVAAAVWTAMANDGLRPIALTRKKWYGTWGNPAPARKFLQRWAKADPNLRVGAPVIADHKVLWIMQKRARAARR